MSHVALRNQALAVVVAVGALLLVPAVPEAQSPCGTYAWCNTSLSPDQRATLLENAMSQSDKIAVLTGDATLGMPTGYHRFVDGPVGVSADQAINGTSLPDALAGATAMPAAIALAANFNPGMARSYGAVVGAEARDRSFAGVWGPDLNIMRTPLGGRTYEGYGEDPFLDGQTAVGWVEGLQSEGEMAVVKHFAENNQEGQLGASPGEGAVGGRMNLNVIVDDRTLHEIELPAFAAAVQQAHAAGVMCAYVQVNGVFSCDSPYLLQTILRGQLGFQGIITSDAGSAHSPQADLNAGMDWDIEGNGDNTATIKLALTDGQVGEATLDARVHEVLRTLFAYGVFDRAPYTYDASATDRVHDTAVADATAEGGATLLKNDGVLPLSSRVRSIAVIGMPAEKYVHGFGSSQVYPYSTTSLLQGIQARAQRAGVSVTYNDGSDVSSAVAVARSADVAIVVAGDSESEGDDKSCMSLTPQCAPTIESTIPPDDPQNAQAAWGDQDSLISAVAAANKRTVVVLETGAPVLTPWRGSIAALLEAWYPGEDGGTAIAHVLFGDVDPGGRLPATFPAQYSQEPTANDPSSYPGVLEPSASQTLYTETYTEGVFVGYRWFDAHHLVPAYPFGFGLSYTTFELSHLRLRRHTVSVTVRNTGKRIGYAVPEVYLGLPATAAVPEPPEQLAGFGKISLAPSRSRTVKIAIPQRSLEYWNTGAQSWSTLPGCVKVMVGTSSAHLALRAQLAQGRVHCGPKAQQ
jgi:beta-glucosidase